MNSMENLLGFTQSSSKPEPFNPEDLIKLMKEKETPHGLVLIPSINGFDVYQFPVPVLKGAINIIAGRWDFKPELPILREDGV